MVLCSSSSSSSSSTYVVVAGGTFFSIFSTSDWSVIEGGKTQVYICPFRVVIYKLWCLCHSSYIHTRTSENQQTSQPQFSIISLHLMFPPPLQALRRLPDAPENVHKWCSRAVYYVSSYLPSCTVIGNPSGQAQRAPSQCHPDSRCGFVVKLQLSPTPPTISVLLCSVRWSISHYLP